MFSNTIKNKIQLMGNLGKDPDLKSIGTDKKVATFSLATNETYYNSQGEKITETIWHNIVAWGKLAEISEKYLSKGSEILLEGRLINRTYADKNGNKKFTSEVQISELVMIGKRLKNEESEPAE
ncbi:MAG: single-stranded DNA-binding protein [Alphaproteobacteria bacterium]|nr:single-stranded DNA-binding protein [Alphaproteobacteria bacterium]